MTVDYERMTYFRPMKFFYQIIPINSSQLHFIQFNSSYSILLDSISHLNLLNSISFNRINCPQFKFIQLHSVCFQLIFFSLFQFTFSVCIQFIFSVFQFIFLFFQFLFSSFIQFIQFVHSLDNNSVLPQCKVLQKMMNVTCDPRFHIVFHFCSRRRAHPSSTSHPIFE